MLADLVRAIGIVGDRSVRRTLLIALGLALVVIVILFPAVDQLIRFMGSSGYPWMDRAGEALGVIGTAIAAYFLFPIIVAAVMGFFLERVVETVERRHRPGLPTVRDVPLVEVTTSAVRFGLVSLGLNILCLPFYLVPFLNLPVFVALNGYLFGREYLELVLQRRMPTAAVTAMRRAHKSLAWRIGLVTALIAMVPFVNIVAPIIGSAFATLQLHRHGLVSAGDRLSDGRAGARSRDRSAV